MKKLAILLSIVFAVAIALSITIPALAATDTDTVTVTGSVQTAIEISSPMFVFLGSLTPGTSTESADKLVTVRCNKAGWTLTVADATGAPIGHMKNETFTASLINPLELKGNSKPYAYLNTSVTLESGTGSVAGITNINDVRFRQATEWTDLIDNYGMIVLFTATIP